MKLPLAFGLLSLLPLAATATPVVSNPTAGLSTLAEAERGLVFGGFFTLYSFAVPGPAAPAEAGETIARAAVVELEGGSPPAQAVIDALGLEVDVGGAPSTPLIRPARPARTGPAGDADPLGRLPLPARVDPVNPYGPVPMPADAEIPEPSTLLLAALAALALLTVRGRAARRRLAHAAVR
jgi:hypothetical protein